MFLSSAASLQGGQPQNFPKREIRGSFSPKEEDLEVDFFLKRKLFQHKEEAFSPKRKVFHLKEGD